jgi:transcriptional regulator with PAS, ATPase and Fis domain
VGAQVAGKRGAGESFDPRGQAEARRAIEARAAWDAVSAAFGALGRVFVCADAAFTVLHASSTLDTILGAGSSSAAEGRPLAELLGADLFGPAGTLRLALLAGEKREGWRALVQVAGAEPRLVSISVAPFSHSDDVACDPRVTYIVVVRPAEQAAGRERGEPVTVGGMIARSHAMRRVFDLVENLQHTEATVLITGESGTGKELLARAIHALSSRRGGPFVAVNCGALPGDLLEAEMFGHVRGAFTGAVRDREGRFELAADGTIFLDEIGDLPLPLQVKLLRVLQDGRFERVGESQTRSSRARVIAATNTDLARAVRERRFREDLYYRLRVVPVEVPPLRHRREDIEPIAAATLARVGARRGRDLRFSPDAVRTLLGYDWPGNVRELENAVEYAVAVCRGQTILPEDLPTLGVAAGGDEDVVPSEQASGSPSDYGTASLSGEGARLRRVLDRHQWRRSEVARALGISRTTLWRRLRQHGLY